MPVPSTPRYRVCFTRCVSGSTAWRSSTAIARPSAVVGVEPLGNERSRHRQHGGVHRGLGRLEVAQCLRRVGPQQPLDLTCRFGRQRLGDHRGLRFFWCTAGRQTRLARCIVDLDEHLRQLSEAAILCEPRLRLRPGLGRDDACDRLASLLAGQGARPARDRAEDRQRRVPPVHPGDTDRPTSGPPGRRCRAGVSFPCQRSRSETHRTCPWWAVFGASPATASTGTREGRSVRTRPTSPSTTPSTLARPPTRRLRSTSGARDRRPIQGRFGRCHTGPIVNRTSASPRWTRDQVGDRFGGALSCSERRSRR